MLLRCSILPKSNFLFTLKKVIGTVIIYNLAFTLIYLQTVFVYKYSLLLNNQKDAVKYAVMLDSALSATTHPNNQAIEDATSRKIIRKLFEDYKREYKQDFFRSIPYMPGKEKLSNQEKAVDYLNSLRFSEQEIADIILSSRTGISTQKNRIQDKTNPK